MSGDGSFIKELVGALLGTLAGAWLAFYFERRNRAKEQTRVEKAALERTRFILESQREKMQHLQKDYLASLRDSPERHLKLGKMPLHASMESVPFDNLVFLASTGQQDLLDRVLRADQVFHTAIGLIRQRNEYCEFLHRADVSRNAESDRQILDLTNNLYIGVDEVVNQSPDAINGLKNHLASKRSGT